MPDVRNRDSCEVSRNRTVCDATKFAPADAICFCQRMFFFFFYLANVRMKLGAARLCYFVFR